MDQLVQCPVCTLFLHNGMTLESHLDTHPKDQVIKALCSIANKNSSCGSSRTSTPANSERSYRSRSQTPAAEDNGRWNSSHRNSEHDRYWARTPSGSSRAPSGMSSRAPSRTPSRTPCRTPKSVSSTNVSRNCTPDIRLVDNLAYETTTISSSSQNSNSHQSHSNLSNPRSLKVDKMQQTYAPLPPVDFEQKYLFYPDQQQEEREIKYSRSAEYSAINADNVFPYNVPTIRTVPAAVKFQPNVTPHVTKKRNDPVKLMPKSNLLNVVNGNIAGMPYLAPGVKPMHVVVRPAAPTFVQKNVQNSVIMTGALPNPQVHIDAKTVPPLVQNHFNQLSSSTYTPGTTVVTQNSQYFYQEMVQKIAPKTFIPTIPAVFTSENVTNVAQTRSVYQNVMLVDQFGNTSCMYTTPQKIIPKQCTPQMFPHTNTLVANEQKPGFKQGDQKTLVFEVAPMRPSVPVSSCSNTVKKVFTRPLRQIPATVSSFSLPKAEAPSITITEKVDMQTEAPGTTKGLKILSNIKVEVPVQHNKNMINTVMDLTGSNDTDDPERTASPEKIFPELEEHQQKHSLDLTKPSTSRGDTSYSFAVLKKITSPTSNQDSSSKTSSVDNKLDMEFGDSCPVPDLICNEKPSISPISELSENGDNSTDHSSLSPIPQVTIKDVDVDSKEKKTHLPIKPFKSTPLRLNNIFVKKSKKVLQIKNMKAMSESSTSEQDEPMPCSSTSSVPVSFNNQVLKTETKQKSILTTISIEEIKEKDELLGFGHRSEDVKPQSIAKSDTTSEIIVKEEISSSNEGAFSNDGQHDDMAVLDPIRPVTVISYGNISTTDFEAESSNRELLNLEGAGKTKQFVNMINENYFGDNIYADYFTADKVESFDEKGPAVFKENEKETFSCNIWGGPSNKENEFVLPNFIHESYKIADSGMDYVDSEKEECQGETEGGEKDSKTDVLSESRSVGEPPLNICSDERMPPRGELSGQESNGDMDSSEWNGGYSEVTPAEPYDLIARESWVSDGSELDVTEKQESLEEVPQYPKARMYTCSQCGAKLPSAKELRTHKAAAHALPTCSSYSRIVTATSIKKEEKVEDTGLSCAASILTLDTKDTITSTILQVYDTIEETKPRLDLRGLLKQETKRKQRNNFVCPTCKMDLLTDAAFNAHLRTHPLECLKCGKLFFRRANLKLHLKTHLGIKNYKCEICEKRFVTRQKLSEHHNIHTGRAPVKCTLCDETFRRYSNMVQHRNRHHFNKRTKVRDFVCHCGLVVHSRAKFAWHQETHEDRPKACVHCGDKFVHAASLTRHVRRKHNHLYLSVPTATRADNVPCPICKQIYLRTNLRAHLLTHSGKRPYSCVICNKAFTTKWNLKLHRWTHVSRSAKPFKCSLCKGAFVRRTEYVSHMNSHKSVRPYTCNYCGCQFIRKYNCQRHVREHETAKKFVCTVPDCGKSFHRSYYLSEHMKVHSGARPFSCNICGKTSSNKSNHNKHVKIHHAREPVATEA